MIPNPRLFSFVGGYEGSWRVESARAIVGDALPVCGRIRVVEGSVASPAGAAWALHGVTSNERYVTRVEKGQLIANSPPLGRPEADCAALIPIRKNPKWWALTQDDRVQP